MALTGPQLLSAATELEPKLDLTDEIKFMAGSNWLYHPVLDESKTPAQWALLDTTDPDTALYQPINFTFDDVGGPKVIVTNA